MISSNIKICGISDKSTLLNLIELNIDFIGFIFYKNSPRNVDVNFLEQIPRINFKNSRPVCVFVNESRENILNITSFFKNPIIQFHGDESDEFCSSFELDFWKVVRIKNNLSLKTIDSYKSATAILLENYKEGIYGGTGQSFNWKLLKNMDISGRKIVLSGGINVKNVDNAIRISPWCIDLNSGVESEKGIKDINLVTKIIKKIR